MISFEQLTESFDSYPDHIRWVNDGDDIYCLFTVGKNTYRVNFISHPYKGSYPFSGRMIYIVSLEFYDQTRTRFALRSTNFFTDRNVVISTLIRACTQVFEQTKDCILFITTEDPQKKVLYNKLIQRMLTIYPTTKIHYGRTTIFVEKNQ